MVEDSDNQTSLSHNESIAARISYLEGAVASSNRNKLKPLADPSFILAATAFFISLVTTTYTIVREKRQNTESLTSQMRTNLYELGEIGYKYAESSAKYKGDNDSLSAISTWAGVENNIATTQAKHLAAELGSNAEPTDLLLIANRLRMNGDPTGAEQLLEQASKLATQRTDVIAVAREYGSLLYSSQPRRFEKGTDQFQKAIDAVQNTAGWEGDPQSLYELSFTYWTWAQNEGKSDCGNAKIHVQRAFEYATKAPVPDWFKSQLQTGQNWLNTNCPS